MGRLLRVLAVMAGAQGVTAEPLGPHIMPVIGVLTQPPGAEFDSANYSLIDASYVHYLESGGAVVVPILFNATSEETEQTFMTISGILFTGGPDKVSLTVRASPRLSTPVHASPRQPTQPTPAHASPRQPTPLGAPPVSQFAPCCCLANGFRSVLRHCRTSPQPCNGARHAAVGDLVRTALAIHSTFYRFVWLPCAQFAPSCVPYSPPPSRS